MPALNDLQQLRKNLYLCFHKRKDATMNLLDALTDDGNKYNSVVQLSDSVFFERQYSGITDAIADGLTDVNWNEIRKLIFQHTHVNNEKAPYTFIIDCTPNPRPYSRKLEDKHITHLPNPAPGNRPICVGHQYSVMALLPSDVTAQKKHWLIPVVAKRVQSSQKGNEVGMEELVNCINEQKLTDRLCISIADSLYATEKCRETASKQDNLVHIVRLNSTRNVFAKPSSEDHSCKGRKTFFQGLRQQQISLTPKEIGALLDMVYSFLIFSKLENITRSVLRNVNKSQLKDIVF